MGKYKVVVHWSDPDGAFVAAAPELPGCMAHGPTEEAARREIHLAMDLWIETAKEFGDPIPEPSGERLVLGQDSAAEQAGVRQTAFEDCEGGAVGKLRSE